MSISAENDPQGEFHSTRGSVFADVDCLLQSRDDCAHLAVSDHEISNSSRCIHIQDQIPEKSRLSSQNESIRIHHVPVEILSLIFILVKETYDDECERPTFVQPRTSPPLHIGAICRKWREITLQTPQLWVDIKVNLGKPADGQACMVQEWASRAGALPINLEVFLSREIFYGDGNPEGNSGAVTQVLRSLAIRWNDVALHTSWYFCDVLFNDLEESPSLLGLLHFSLLDDTDARLHPIKLRHPFRPKYFHSWNVSRRQIPLEWGDLVLLEVCEIEDVEILHIIRHAPRLRYCTTEPKCLFAYGWHGSLLTPTATTHIVHHSLVYLRTTIDIFGHLTLPSLQHLYYHRIIYFPDHYPNSLIELINRSSPPLEEFSLQCEHTGQFYGDYITFHEAQRRD